MRNAELNDMSYLTRTPISLDLLVAEVSSPACGGACVFLGTVRNGPDEQGVTAIEYSAYEEMVEAEFVRLLTDARARWPDARIAVRHRLGTIPVGEASIAIAPPTGLLPSRWRTGTIAAGNASIANPTAAPHPAPAVAAPAT